MANLISPQNVQVVTKDGEIVVSLKLDLNINLNGGQISVPIMKKLKLNLFTNQMKKQNGLYQISSVQKK